MLYVWAVGQGCFSAYTDQVYHESAGMQGAANATHPLVVRKGIGYGQVDRTVGSAH